MNFRATIEHVHAGDSRRRLTRRRFLSASGALLLWGMLAGCRGAKAGPLRVAAHKWPGYEMMFMAEREGVLDQQLVRLVETPSASLSLRALAEGAADAAALTLDEVLRVRAGGLPLSAVLVFDVSAGADVVLARPGIRSLADVRGKKVGAEQGALGALMLAEFLKAAGLQHNEVELVSLPIDQHEAAWKRGDVDVLVCFPPVSTHLLDAGAVKLFDSRRIPDTIVDVLAVRRDMLEQKRKAIRHLVATHFRYVDHLQLNPQDASYRMAGHLGIPAQEVLAAFKGIILPDIEHNRRLLGGSRPGLRASARNLVEIMLAEKILTRPDMLADLLRDDFLPEEKS